MECNMIDNMVPMPNENLETIARKPKKHEDINGIRLEDSRWIIVSGLKAITCINKETGESWNHYRGADMDSDILYLNAFFNGFKRKELNQNE